ncbi:putative phage tail tape measure protein [uncultured Mediterranean phage uvMED]|nr:putative phage tail tape measure protein [uncultured Mediterranean phage uvMED]
MAVSNIVLNIVTKGAELAKRQLSGIGNSGDKGAKGLGKFGTAMKIGVVAGAVAMSKALVEATKQFIAFDDAMTQSLAIMNATVEQQEDMGRTARKVALETTFSAKETAESFFFLASAGLDAEQQIQALPQVAKFAQAGMFDMATATDLATDAQSALGLTVSDAQQNLSNLTRVTDVLVKANTLANASVQQFSEALTSKAGSALKVVNKDIEEGVAVLAVFADAGVKGAEGGEKLNQVLRDIPRATAKNGKEFAKLGLEMFDAQGNMKNVADIVEELDRVLKPMSDELKASTLDQLGLNRGVADAVKILSGSTDKIREYESALRDSGGTTQEVADNQLTSLQSQITILGDKFGEIGLLIMEGLSPALEDAIGFFDRLATGIISVLDPQSDFNKRIEEGTKLMEEQGLILGMGGVEYDKYSNAQQKANEAEEELIQSHKDFAQAMRELEQEQNYLNAVQEDAINNAHRYEIESMNVSDALIDQSDVTKELTEEEIKLNKERANKSLGLLQKVLGAYQKLKDIEENVIELQNDEKSAKDKLTKAQENQTLAQIKADTLLDELNKQREKSKQVTLEEELAIERQKQAIEKLNNVEERTKVQELELQIAKERLNELIDASTLATRQEEQAQSDYQSALDDVAREKEKVKKATEDLEEATKDLNKATDKSIENILEQAIAKKELDDALADVTAIGALKEGLQQMVDSVGGSLGDLYLEFKKIFDLSGSPVSSSFGGGGGGKSPTVFDTSGGQADKFVSLSGGGGSNSSFAGSDAFRVMNNTNINVNVEGALQDRQSIQDAVAIAVKKASDRGIEGLA